MSFNTPTSIDHISNKGRSCRQDTNAYVGIHDQGLVFGDFVAQDFVCNGVQNVGVEFLCDTYHATKCWVEEVSNHTFSCLDQVDDKKDDKEERKKIYEAEHAESSETINNAETLENNMDSKTDITNLQDTINITKTDNSFGASGKKEVAQPPAKPSTWASLFKSEQHTNGTSISVSTGVLSVQMEDRKFDSNLIDLNGENAVSLISMCHDERASNLADHISRLTPNYTRHHLQLRGLINRGNWCYINSTLQALLGISSISHFYKALRSFTNSSNKSTSTPLTDSMILFFNEFEPVNPKFPLKKQTDDLRAGNAFEPRCVYDVLPVMKTSLSEKGRQQDAEEFLSFLLNGIHDELVELQKLVKAKSEHATINGIEGSADHGNDVTSSTSDEDSWEHVGRKNKSSTVRKAVIQESLIKHVFGGVIRSSVLQTGVKESTTLQPFFTLQLDIQSEKVWTLKDAIESYFMKENLQGFTCAKTNTEVEASRRSSLEELPLVFIFHLKYFVFDRKGGCQKIHKGLDIPVDLEIPKDILSANLKTKIQNSSRNYKLYAVVYHHGKNSAGGHYTAAVHHGNPFGWIHFDDNIIKAVNVMNVLKHQQGCVPYLLFYELVQTR